MIGSGDDSDHIPGSLFDLLKDPGDPSSQLSLNGATASTQAPASTFVGPDASQGDSGPQPLREADGLGHCSTYPLAAANNVNSLESLHVHVAPVVPDLNVQTNSPHRIPIPEDSSDILALEETFSENGADLGVRASQASPEQIKSEAEQLRGKPLQAEAENDENRSGVPFVPLSSVLVADSAETTAENVERVSVQHLFDNESDSGFSIGSGGIKVFDPEC